MFYKIAPLTGTTPCLELLELVCKLTEKKLIWDKITKIADFVRFIYLFYNEVTTLKQITLNRYIYKRRPIKNTLSIKELASPFNE